VIYSYLDSWEKRWLGRRSDESGGAVALEGRPAQRQE
jgi:hypothetical protein